MARSRKPLVRDQISQFYFTDEGPRDALGLYARMFVEDVSQGLVPPSARFHDSKLKVEITPPNDGVAGILAGALDSSHSPSYHREFPNALFEFLRYTMVDICLHDRAAYEIVYLRERQDGQPTSFEFTHLSGKQLVERRGHLFQRLPREIAAERGTDEITLLPRERLAVFTLPEPHGRLIRDAMRSLRILSDSEWHQLAVEAQNSKTPYDFAAHERSFNIALAESLRRIGWGARGSFQRKVINYYWLRQEFRFRRFEMEVREILLEQLNSVLQWIGPALGWSAQITVKGLPVGTDYERALGQLEHGTKPFLEIMDSVREYTAENEPQ